jgi:hypothetical protein
MALDYLGPAGAAGGPRSTSFWVWSEPHARVLRDPQGLIQVRVIEDVPEPIYDLSISLRLIRNYQLDARLRM